ncbi:hypothetical protein INR49_011575 [Caranx melampygus]|nr:hypothetical protein INR49_011575 [Caranx melampygus]
MIVNPLHSSYAQRSHPLCLLENDLARGPVVLLMLLLVTMSVSQDNDEEPLVLTTQTGRHLTPIKGSSVKLSCQAKYDLTRCGHVHVVWKNVKENAGTLTDPRKYLMTVSETELNSTMRRRQVMTEILDLRMEDTGGYQCTAECEKGVKASEIGHIIRITVQG